MKILDPDCLSSEKGRRCNGLVWVSTSQTKEILDLKVGNKNIEKHEKGI